MLKKLLRLWAVDPKLTPGYKNRSASLTFTIVAFILAWIKLFLSDVEIWGYKFSTFTSEDYVLVFVGTASLYFGQKSVAVLATRKEKSSEEQPKQSETDKAPVEGP